MVADTPPGAGWQRRPEPGNACRAGL